MQRSKPKSSGTKESKLFIHCVSVLWKARIDVLKPICRASTDKL